MSRIFASRGHNTTLWPGFTCEFWRRTRHVDARNYKLTPQCYSVTYKR